MSETTIHVDGLPIFARISTDPVPEDAPTVILVHGLVVSSRYLMPTAERLAPDFRVLAPDLPGFGRSGKPASVLSVCELAGWLAAWMRAVGVSRAAMVGNSMGCQVITELAVREPDLVERIVLQGPSMDREHRTWYEQFMKLIRAMPHEAPSQGLISLTDLARCGPRRASLTLSHALDDRIEERLPRVRVPALVVGGSCDPISPERWIEELTRLLPDGRQCVIPGGSHAMVYSMPREFVHVIRPFLDEARVPRVSAEHSCLEAGVAPGLLGGMKPHSSPP